MIELCVQIKKRFPFEVDSVLSMLRVFEPKEALSSNRTLQTIAKLAVHFPSVVKKEDLDELQEQWRDLLYSKDSLHSLNMKMTTFWCELRSVKDGCGKAKFDLLSKFMCSLLALPHSSACVERVFSQVNLMKNKQTNRLKVQTVANRLLAKQAIARQEMPCYQWKPSNTLLKDVKEGVCYRRQKEKEMPAKKKNVVHLLAEDDSEEEETLGFLQ